MGDFPQGLKPASWMGDLTSKKLDPELAKTIPVTWFAYPGSHDAATYGKGMADFSYQCQDKNLYEQMKTGQRAFDVRLAIKEGGKKFIPCHGAAKGTADDFSQGPDKADDNDLATQIMKFAKEHPTEIIILKIKFDGMDKDDERKLWADTAWKLLGNRLLEAPDKGEPPPTYASAVESNRNIIMATGLPNRPGKEHPAIKYYWNVGNNTDNWLGDGNEMLWNEPTWQSGDIKKVIKSTEDYIEKNSEKIDKRDKFWAASVQLTPALGGSISTFISSGGSVRPKDLALGGGIGTHGSFKGSNKELRESGTLKKRAWKRHASLVMYDFADTDTAGDIVAMNLPPLALYDEKGGAEQHEGGGRGGRGGGHGGRGGGRGGRGRGGHDD